MDTPEPAFDFARIHGRTFEGASGTGATLCNDGRRAFDSIRIAVQGDLHLLIDFTEDSDEITVRTIPSDSVRMDETALEWLDEYKGMPIGWSWEGTNWKGYRDMIVLSFSGVDPQVAFYVMGSSILCYRWVSEGSGIAY